MAACITDVHQRLNVYLIELRKRERTMTDAETSTVYAYKGSLHVDRTSALRTRVLVRARELHPATQGDNACDCCLGPTTDLANPDSSTNACVGESEKETEHYISASDLGLMRCRNYSLQNI